METRYPQGVLKVYSMTKKGKNKGKQEKMQKCKLLKINILSFSCFPFLVRFNSLSRYIISPINSLFMGVFHFTRCTKSVLDDKKRTFCVVTGHQKEVQVYHYTRTAKPKI